jgi:hypothetical protein
VPWDFSVVVKLFLLVAKYMPKNDFNFFKYSYNYSVILVIRQCQQNTGKHALSVLLTPVRNFSRVKDTSKNLSDIEPI